MLTEGDSRRDMCWLAAPRPTGMASVVCQDLLEGFGDDKVGDPKNWPLYRGDLVKSIRLRLSSPD